MKIVLNGNKGSVTQQGKTQPLEGKALASFQNSTGIFPELKYTDPGYRLEAKDIREVNGQKAYRVVITNPQGYVTTNYYDTGTHLKVRTESPQGSAVLSDYKAVKGIMFPYSSLTDYMDHTSKLTVKQISLNAPIADNVFL